MTGNEFFLRATGLSEREAKRLTIFSIVQPSELSNLYKMVARALAKKKDTSDNITAIGTIEDCPGTNTNEDEWQAITLECTPFSRNIKSPSTTSSGHDSHSLSITVALMEDKNHDQRCFHCILTDCPVTNGKSGSVTPELFARLFTPDDNTKMPCR